MPTKVTTEKCIEVIDMLHDLCPNRKIKQTDIVEELARQGITITKSTICKNEEVRKHLDKVNSTTFTIKDIKQIVYVPLDIQSLGGKTKEQIIEIVIQRENYYKACAESAAKVRKQVKEFQDRLEEEIENRIKGNIEKVNKYKEENDSLKAIINNYILPEMANDLLGVETKDRKTPKNIDIITGMDVISPDIDLTTGEILNDKQYENSVLNNIL